MAARRHEWELSLSAAEVAEVEAAVAALLQQAEAGPANADGGGGDAGLTAAAQQLLAGLTPERFPLPTLGPRLAALRQELLHGRGFALLRRLPVDSCDVVGLLCLREAASGGDSLLVSADTLFNELRSAAPHLAARLLAPMPHDRRGEVPAGQLPFFDIPVFSWFEEQLTVFYQRQYFDSAQRFPEARRLTEEDVAALDALDALANDSRLNLTMRLAPGDMQWVHNHNMLHDRTAFTDHPEPGRRRHLLRLWLAVPGARPLPPAFAARYGSLTVGDRGGIVVPGMQLTVPLKPE
ncbi:hypothetical protein GPECTOR_62g917 [Gonium pectorale]|uniref:TauD/TfdA-like domain-containing protein n=1 Tax=Gonium pectorale TaxID=33097 RepID=A0A150G4L7_GONPE|nr:hypothetical protein GPECTOR_62g917 [Gonium pectorale]|eukprot:KXZ44802.1 hypothetical protein GPECTOR_62g917 [Gonium pectorale]